jgi:hypothetical protein
MTGAPPSLVAPDGYPNPRPIVGTWSLEEFIQVMRNLIK